MHILGVFIPFKSKAQQRYLYSQHPEIAEEFEEKTPRKSYKNLPEYASNPKSKSEHMKNLSNRYMRSKSIK